jgi:hypothetical protein
MSGTLALCAQHSRITKDQHLLVSEAECWYCETDPTMRATREHPCPGRTTAEGANLPEGRTCGSPTIPPTAEYPGWYCPSCGLLSD